MQQNLTGHLVHELHLEAMEYTVAQDIDLNTPPIDEEGKGVLSDSYIPQMCV